MRRLLSFTFLSGLLIASPFAFGQRGGSTSAGHSFGGGFSGHSSGSGFSGHSFGGSFVTSPGRISGGFGSAPRMTFTAPNRAFVTPAGPSATYRNGGWNRGGSDRYRSPYRGYGYGAYPYANSWEVLPWDLGYPDFAGYGSDDSGGAVQQSSGQEALPPDNGYRPGYDEEAGPSYGYGPPGYAPPGYAPPAATAPVASEPHLTLIFRDGHQQTIQNYVLTSDSVIVMDQAASGRQQRIPLANLDLPATEQAAQQAGLDFTPPV